MPGVYIGTSPLKEAYVGTTPVKQIYVGTNLVRPIKKIECDFTTSDNGFTYYGVIGSPSYGRNSTYGLYGYKSSGTNMAVAWKIPSSVYSQGELSKAVLTARSSQTRSGVGLSLGVDTTVARIYDNILICNFGSSTSLTLPSYVAANTDYTITIDLQNKQMYVSTATSSILTLTDAQVASIKSSWSGGNMNVCALGYRNGGTCYFGIKNATFTVS